MYLIFFLSNCSTILFWGCFMKNVKLQVMLMEVHKVPTVGRQEALWKGSTCDLENDEVSGS